jgi:hypothetical protein
VRGKEGGGEGSWEESELARLPSALPVVEACVPIGDMEILAAKGLRGGAHRQSLSCFQEHKSQGLSSQRLFLWCLLDKEPVRSFAHAPRPSEHARATLELNEGHWCLLPCFPLSLTCPLFDPCSL